MGLGTLRASERRRPARLEWMQNIDVIRPMRARRELGRDWPNGDGPIEVNRRPILNRRDANKWAAENLRRRSNTAIIAKIRVLGERSENFDCARRRRCHTGH